MTDLRGGRDGRAIAPGRSPSASVLAERMAAALLHHEPGWRLPRHTALARRYNVTTAEIDAAIDLLAERHLLTRLPDGQVFRASPAEYRLALEGLPGFATHVDPMGGELVCKSRNVSKRRAAEDIARALGAPPGNELLTIRCLWTVGGEPAAFSASYLPAEMEGLVSEFTQAASPIGPAPRHGRPCAFQVEFSPPAPSVARSLRLSAAAPAATVTVRFEEPSRCAVIALAVAVLRPDLFRIVVESPGIPKPTVGPDGLPGAWTHGLEDWEP
ncbi:MAG TPA: UTRA domain-containing protein [Streptosporangiaceae bacterium]|nr:UTRA domain-containing protein [Streptosporangiaceae bacterium]